MNMRWAKNIDPEQLGEIVGGFTHTTITIRNDLLPEGLREALGSIGDFDWGDARHQKIGLTKETCERILAAVLTKLRAI